MSPVPLLRAYDEVVEFLSRAPSVDDIARFRLSSDTIGRVRDLLTRKSAGTLPPTEEDELDQCVMLDRIVTLIRARSGVGERDTP